jgi:hypothetical protein
MLLMLQEWTDLYPVVSLDSTVIIFETISVRQFAAICHLVRPMVCSCLQMLGQCR